MAAKVFSETSVDFQWSPRRYNTEDGTLQSCSRLDQNCAEQLEAYMVRQHNQSTQQEKWYYN
jgi:hypothetical protein